MKNTQVKKASPNDALDSLIHARYLRFSPKVDSDKGAGYCFVCGQKEFKFSPVLNNDLTEEWELDEKLRRAFDRRESTSCQKCKASLRSNMHAKAICKIISPNSERLVDAVEDTEAQKLLVAEINACGTLHPVLNKLPNLSYSEYDPSDKKIRHEDLHNLSYKDGTFDIVLTSETLEHVPDWQLSLKEINRVLKHGGKHIFTVPAILTRKTRYRTKYKNGKEYQILPPSFHGCTQGKQSDDYIVRTEFGSDFRKEVDKLGFKTHIYYLNALHLYDPSFVFVSKKV